LDVAARNDQAAVERLKKVDANRFQFGWQRARYQRVLGEALFHTGDYEGASQQFREMRDSGGGAWNVAMADNYLAMAKEQSGGAATERVAKRVAEIAALMKEKNYVPPAPADLWTSRPMVFCLLPVNAGGGGGFARESGLAEALPDLLGRALIAATPMKMVNRELLDRVLTEQELSARLGTVEGRVRLGQVLGARVYVECRCVSVLGKDVVTAEIIDTETTQQIPVAQIEVDPRADPQSVIAGLATAVQQALAEAYPLRGIVSNGPNGPEINIGRAEGLKAGTRFHLSPAPDTSRPEGVDKCATAREPIEDHRAAAALENCADTEAASLRPAADEELPKAGWYAWAEPQADAGEAQKNEK
jgi:hypothetical protein